MEMPGASPGGSIDFMSVEEKKSANLFYLALVVLGVLFAVTASAYGVMMLVSIREGGMAMTGTPLVEQHPMMKFMDQYGFQLMLWEIGLLSVATVLAITTDTLRERRAESAGPAGDSRAGGKS